MWRSDETVWFHRQDELQQASISIIGGLKELHFFTGDWIFNYVISFSQFYLPLQKIGGLYHIYYYLDRNCGIVARYLYIHPHT